MYLEILVKFLNTELHENPCSGSHIVLVDRWLVGMYMTRLVVTVHFAKVPRNGNDDDDTTTTTTTTTTTNNGGNWNHLKIIQKIPE
jgi:hypothetical protein